MKSVWDNSKTRRVLVLQCVLVVMLFSVSGRGLIADSFSDRRAHVGLKLFRTLVAADLQSPNKVSGDGALPIYLVYASNDNAALDYRRTLMESLPRVRDIPVRVDVHALADVLADSADNPAAIFVTQRLNDAELRQLVNYSIAQRIIVFSPFEGDVEKGVLGGLSVEATVRPLINMRTLAASKLAIKNFYLKVAKQYE
ncbi:MAG: hypothetical protein P8Y45_10935 [Exilibacterium sp.]